MCMQKITFWQNLLRTMEDFCIFCVFLKRTILTQKKFFKNLIFEQKVYNVLDFALNFLKHVFS